jgi:lactate permease
LQGLQQNLPGCKGSGYNLVMPLNLLTWLLSFLPLVVVMVLMLGFRASGKRASAAGWVTAVLVSLLAFGGTWKLLAYAQVKALWMSLDVLYIVWGALLLYNLVHEAGAIQAISTWLPSVSGDKAVQVLLVSWLMVSFLQGMGGFGVPMAVCAPILVGMGYSPVLAVVMTAIGHAWAVNFGSMATAFQALTAVTGLSGAVLAPKAAILLGLAILPSGMIVAVLGSGWKGLWHTFPLLCVVSLVMGTVQYFLAVNGLWNLAATTASLAGLLVMLLLLRTSHSASSAQSTSRPDLLVLISPYLILMLVGFAVILIAPLNAFLSRTAFSLNLPELSTQLGWVTAAERTRPLHPFSHPGSILVFTVLVSWLIYARKGYLSEGAGRRIAGNVVKSAGDASLGVIAMVGVAAVMTTSGMTNLLARGLSQSISTTLYPAMAPFIGVLGAFLTGSNNNSNVLFGVLQMETARLMGLDVPLILAAQTAGGSLGSVMSPAKVIVGCSTVGLNQKEGLVMRRLVLLDLIPVVIVAAAALIWSVLLGAGG